MGCCSRTLDQLKSTLDGLNKAEPMIRDLATDQSLRGLTTGVDNALMAVRSKYLTLDDLAASFNMISDTLDKIIAGQPASFSWRVLAQRKPAEKNELRGFIEVRPVLDYKALEPGHAAIAAIRSAAAEVAPQYQATVRLTGPVPMADEEFATLKENAELNGIITLGIVLFILWLALRSKRLIAGGVHQSVRRLVAHGGVWPFHGRRVQPDLGVVRGAVRRHRRRLRHPVRGALPP